MTSAIRHLAVTETYADVSSILDYVAGKFARTYGLRYDDVRADANSLFMDAYQRHTPNRSAFPTWVRYRVEKGLLEQIRRKRYRSRILPRVPLDPGLPSRVQGNPHGELLEGLTPDGRVVVELVLKEPRPIVNEILDSKKQSRKFADLLADRVTEVLLGMGWTISRILEAFHEVEGTLP
jgi:hypothetical protein